MYISRYLEKEISKKIDNYSKIIVIYGARQVGKTTMVESIIRDSPLKILKVSSDEKKYVDVLSSRDLSKIKSLVFGYDLLFIDEAQRVPDIGINLKLIHDNIPNLKVLVTGSSSFDLANKISEPLTGRTWTYVLYPISALEEKGMKNEFEVQESLNNRLIYGSYPDTYNLVGDEDKKKYLEELSRSYLYKDVLELSVIKNTYVVADLLKLLAFQVGSEVSLSELGNRLGIGKATVARYIDLLEKSFVIFRLGGFSRNLRKEVSKMDKIYFYDNGIRNVLIDNLKPLNFRNDLGQLWENYLVSERKKYLSHKNILCSNYFWRTYTGAELDYVEERGGALYGYEFKWTKSNIKAPKTWLDTYENSSYKLINRSNYLEFVT